MQLSRQQTKLLKKISHSPIVREDKWNAKDLKYLNELGLIEVVSCLREDDYYYEAHRLTEKGKAVLDDQILRYRDRLVPYASLVISIIAIVISVIALLK